MSSHSESKWESLVALVEAEMQAQGIPGVSVGVLHHGETHAAGFGVTNVDHPLPVTDETLFQIGSISKTFTGTLVMRLVEQGALDLDATVRSYLPEFKVVDEEASANATLRHLLTHMGGWVGDYFDDTGPGDDALAKYVANMADLEQLAPLGTVWSYNNAGFVLAGYLVERVTGKSFQQALQEMVLEPLGLAHTFFDPGEVMIRRFAVGHYVGSDGPRVSQPLVLPRVRAPAGGLTCHMHDLLRYARFHMGDGSAADGTRLLSAESLAQMHRPQVTVWGNESWGLTWAVEEFAGVRQISHSGATVGQIAFLGLIPKYDFAVAILTNVAQGKPLTRAVWRETLRDYLDIEMPTPTPVEATEETLRRYTGHYSRPFMDIDLGLLGGKLVAVVTHKQGYPAKDSPPAPSPPPMTLALCEDERLLVLDGPLKDTPMDLVRKPDGSIGWLRMVRIHVRQS